MHRNIVHFLHSSGAEEGVLSRSREMDGKDCSIYSVQYDLKGTIL